MRTRADLALSLDRGAYEGFKAVVSRLGCVFLFLPFTRLRHSPNHLSDAHRLWAVSRSKYVLNVPTILYRTSTIFLEHIRAINDARRYHGRRVWDHGWL